jgi:hypothetical protein
MGSDFFRLPHSEFFYMLYTLFARNPQGATRNAFSYALALTGSIAFSGHI